MAGELLAVGQGAISTRAVIVAVVPSTFARRLLENQLQLHARSRAPRREREGATCFEDPSPNHRYWLIDRAIALPEELREVRTAPGARITAGELAGLGFQSDGALRYLWRGVPEHAAPRAEVEIERARADRWPMPREAFLQVFSEVQAQGYAVAGKPPDLVETLARNRRGAGAADETWYLASIDGTPAAAAHTFFADGLLGIYGVATLPAFRKRGLASALLLASFAEARELGAEAVTLQTWADSAPERLYRQHGFVPAFDVGLWVRGKPPRGRR